MRQFVNDLLVQLKGIWARLEGPQRLVVSVVLFAALVGLGGIVWYAGQPSYEVVFRATNGEDLARAEQALQQSTVSYLPGSDGMSLMVERSNVSRANAAISKEGLGGASSPNLSVGGSLIEDAATKQWRLDTVSRAQAQAAIAKLEGVVDVTVTASRPRRLVAFRNRQNEQKASATVLLRLRPGVPFEQLARAAASIAASQLMVPMENIDVVSAAGGRRWSYNPDRDTGGSSSEFRRQEREMSEERTLLAQQSLDQMWPGRTSVRVTVELDPLWEIRSEKVLPDEAILKSEDKTKDSTDTPSGSAEAAAASSKNEVTKREYVTEIGERRVGKMAPDVRRMSVAVLYDRELETTEEGFRKEDLIRTVKAIVGWDPQRDGDESFSTFAGKFDPTPPAEATAYSGPGFAEVALQWGPVAGQVVGVLVVVLFLRGLFKRSRPAPTPELELEPEIPEEDLAPEEQQRRMRREIERSIANDPAALAKLLEAWLMEQKA